jgi:hypothetical protein
MTESPSITRGTTPRIRQRRSWLPLLLIPIAAAIGAWSIMQTPPITGNGFVGRLATTTDLIAITTEGKQVIAFVSDDHIRATWFHGANRSPLELRADDGSTLRAHVQDEQLIGSVHFVTARGEHRFVAQPAVEQAGLYRGYVTRGGQRARVGWVILNDGTQAGTTRLTSTQSPLEINPQVLRAPKLEPNKAVVMLDEFVTAARVR